MFKHTIGLISALCVGLLVTDLWLQARPMEVPVPIQPKVIKIPAELVEADPTLGYRFRPNAARFFSSENDEFSVNYQINEIGLRDSGMISAIKSSPRVLVLGDAFVEGWGMMGDATFIREVQRELRATNGIHPYTRLLNAGMTGFGAAQSYLLSQRVYQTFKPDMILFVYTSLMPVADYRFLAAAEVDENGIAVGLQRNAPNLAPLDRSRRSALQISTLYKIAERYVGAKAARESLVPGDPNTDLFAAARGLDNHVTELHQRSLQHVKAIAEFANQQNIKFLLLHIPLPHQVAPDEWADGRRGYGFGTQTYDAPETKIVEEFCRANQWQCIMSAATLRELAEQRSSPVYYRHDYTLTEVGHRALVALLLDTMKTAVSELPSNTFVR